MAEKIQKTTDQALASLMRLCSRAERSSGDATRLMIRWGLSASERSAVLRKLIEMRFIDDTRYARAFVNDKLRFSGWGVYKIKAALAAKGIAKDIIDQTLAEVEPKKIDSRLAEYLARKNRSIKVDNPYERKSKLVRYGLSLGFEYDTVISEVEKILGHQGDDFATPCED